MSHHPEEPILNTGNAPHFQDVLEKGLEQPSRRQLIRGGFGLASLGAAQAVGLTAATALAASAGTAEAAQGMVHPKTLGFEPVAKGLDDAVVLPPGYSYKVIHATGDAMDFNVPAWSNLGIENDDLARRIGDQHDGMDIFFLTEQGQYTEKDTGRALLVVNHESCAEAAFLMEKGQTSNGQSGKKFDQFGDWDLGVRPELEALKEINLHGVTVTEIRRGQAGWHMVRGSSYNRHITPETEAVVTGPEKDLADIRALFATKRFPKGDRARGTLNNCGMGRSPWGTYLTCEENFYPYFNRTDGAALTPSQALALKRYGVVTEAPKSGKSKSMGWHTVKTSGDASRFERWNIALTASSPRGDYRQEANTFGYVFEIDPARPTSTPAKRVACGRFVHEAAVFGKPVAGKPLAVYMGCDGRNEYIYKFVSKAVWDPKDIGRGMAAGDKYLTEGKLYVAKFNEDGSGEWLELSMKNPKVKNFSKYSFANQADVLVHARLAADAAGGTPMDRPEWGAMNAVNGEIYFALTNNNSKNRQPGMTNAANPRAYADPDGKKRSGNPNGHIIRFREDKNLATASKFIWDIFLFGAEETAGAMNLSKLTAANSFSSPDGLWFSKKTGICWIQTDDGAMTDKSNCMLLAAIPGKVGDGSKVTIRNEMDLKTAEQTSFLGETLGEAKLRRFLVAPKGSEVTGICETPDGRAIFVNIQHPGESTSAADMAAGKYQSSWPGNAGYGPNTGRPRSATIVITRDDGGIVGA
ncbi:MAG: PhoX family protein [Burkholderiaceae bacterium]